jgi:hypothetical protein
MSGDRRDLFTRARQLAAEIVSARLAIALEGDLHGAGEVLMRVDGEIGDDPMVRRAVLAATSGYAYAALEMTATMTGVGVSEVWRALTLKVEAED